MHMRVCIDIHIHTDTHQFTHVCVHGCMQVGAYVALCHNMLCYAMLYYVMMRSEGCVMHVHKCIQKYVSL